MRVYAGARSGDERAACICARAPMAMVRKQRETKRVGAARKDESKSTVNVLYCRRCPGRWTGSRERARARRGARGREHRGENRSLSEKQQLRCIRHRTSGPARTPLCTKRAHESRQGQPQAAPHQHYINTQQPPFSVLLSTVCALRSPSRNCVTLTACNLVLDRSIGALAEPLRSRGGPRGRHALQN